MAYNLDCDTCEFITTVEAESDAYSIARDHESDQPTHFVMIHWRAEALEEESPRG